MRLRDKIRPLLRKIGPAAQIIETATSVLGQLKEPTLFGVANAVAGGLRTAGELAEDTEQDFRWSWTTAIPMAVWIEGFQRCGAVLHDSSDGNRATVTAYLGERVLQVSSFGELLFQEDPGTTDIVEMARKAVDPVLPPCVRLLCPPGKHELTCQTDNLTSVQSKEAARVWRRTKDMLDGGRAILLEGRPGVGKTTVAQAIARDAGLGRTVIIDSTVFGVNSPDPNHVMMRLLSAGVVIVDDLDKVGTVDLNLVETLRNNARLVIFTANNGAHDDVLDGAVMRPARIDEVFSITPKTAKARPPFDKLDQKDWDDVKNWPVAYQNEVEKRLRVRPDDLRLDDLRDRLKRRTRSGGVLA